MPKTINTHTYNLRGTSENGATYGSVVGSDPYAAKMQSLDTRQNGESGVRTSRSITATVKDVEGAPHDVTVSVSCFLPVALSAAALDAPFAELLEWQKVAGFLTDVKNRSVE